MDEEEKGDLGPSLFKTIIESDLPDVAQDIAETALDSILAEGIVKDIPIVSTIIRLGKTAVTIRGYFLLKKVLVFLQGIKQKTKPEERRAFVKRVETDKNYQRRVGEALIMLLDRYDHLDKARLMATLFGAYIKSEINYDKFLRISTAIDSAFIGDLSDLLDYFAGKTSSRDEVVRRASRNLFPSNLANFYVLTGEEYKQSGLEHPQIYSFNKLASEFARIILGDWFQDGR